MWTAWLRRLWAMTRRSASIMVGLLPGPKPGEPPPPNVDGVHDADADRRLRELDLARKGKDGHGGFG
jgi:hypothetical protein